MPARSLARNLAEYAGFQAGVFVARLARYPRAYDWGHAAGRLLYALWARRRRRALENLARAAGLVRGRRQAQRIARFSFGHFVGSTLETLAAADVTKVALSPGHVELRGAQIAERLLARGRGVILVVGHLGNWEVCGMAAASRGHPLVAVAREMDNPLLEGFVTRIRRSTGLGIITRRGAFPSMVEELQRNRVLILLVDQRWRKGIVARFLGRECLTVATPAVLALRCGSPIMPTRLWRTREAPHHHIECEEAIEPDAYRGRPDPVAALTQAVNDRIEAFVRRHPEQWLWLHDRWRL